MKISFTNFWPEDSPKDYWFYKLVDKYICPNPEIVKRKPDIAFFSMFGKKADISRFIRYEKPKLSIFFTGENTEWDIGVVQCHHKMYEDYCINMVDLAIGFKHLDNPKYIRLPLWMTFGHFKDDLGEKDHDLLNTDIYFTPKTKFCCLISRDDIYGVRTKLAKSVEIMGTVDCPGKILHNTGDFNLGPSWKDKFEYLKDYQFCICPENSIGDGYVTEKLFHALACGCIPIYWGSEIDENFFDKNKIINAADFKCNEDLINEIQKRKNDKSWNQKEFMKPDANDKIISVIDSVVDFIKNRLI